MGVHIIRILLKGSRIIPFFAKRPVLAFSAENPVRVSIRPGHRWLHADLGASR